MVESVFSLLGEEAIRRIRLPVDQACGLPRQAYISQEFFNLERERLFPRVWMGIGFTSDLPDRARQLAARHEHVYLETCQAMHDQIERAYLDPQIGADKLVFGSDWGASISYHRVEGKVYAGTPFGKPPKTLVHHQDWATRQIDKIEMPEEDRAKILGLNLAKLCKIDVEKRLWAEQEKYGKQIKNEAVPEITEWEQRPVGSKR